MINLPDIAGSNAVVNIGAIALAQGFVRFTARWVQFVVTGSGTVRIGGANVSASIGIPVTNSQSQFLPAIASGDAPPPYGLNSLNAYVPAGATLNVAFEPYN